MYITIEILTKENGAEKENLLGYTKIDLEKRFFNELYSKNLE